MDRFVMGPKKYGKYTAMRIQVKLRKIGAVSIALLALSMCFSSDRHVETQTNTSDVPANQSYTYHYTVDAGVRPPEEVGDFLKNLSKYYLQLSEGHKKFKILNGAYLEQGAIIDDEETVGGQTLKHKYVVQKVVDNAYYKLVSDPSKVMVFAIFAVNVKTTVEFIISHNEQGHTLLESVLIIEFKDGTSKFFADAIGTEEIWGKHLKEEMDNGAKLIKSKNTTLL